MVQLNRIGTGNGVISSPAIAIPVGAGCHQPMQDGEKNRSFDIKLESTSLQQSLQRLFDPGLFPQSLENQGRSYFNRHRIGIAVPGEISKDLSEYRERDRISVSTRPFSCR